MLIVQPLFVFKRVSYKLFFLIFLLFVSAFILFSTTPILQIRDQINNVIIIEKQVSCGDNLWVVFINSVEHLPVAEHFIIDQNNNIILSETIYQAPYAGYTHEERARTIAPGTSRISDLDYALNEITFYAGYNSKHLLFLNGRWVPLYDYIKGGEIIQIRILYVSKFLWTLRGTQYYDG